MSYDMDALPIPPSSHLNLLPAAWAFVPGRIVAARLWLTYLNAKCASREGTKALPCQAPFLERLMRKTYLEVRICNPDLALPGKKDDANLTWKQGHATPT